MFGELLVDWIVPFGLIAALVIMVQLRDRLIAIDERAYHFVTSGLGFLALAVVLRLHHQGGLLTQMPFVSDPIFYRLIFWSAITAGIGLVVSGVASYLAVISTRNASQRNRLAGLELIRTVERLLTIEPRATALLATTAEHLAKSFGASMKAIYRREQRTGDLCRIDLPDQPVISSLPERIDSAEIPDRLATLSEQTQLTNFPVRTGNGVEAVMLLGPSLALTSEDRMNISVVCDILGHRLALDIESARLKAETDRSAMLQELRERARKLDSQSRVISLLLSKVRDLMQLDQASLSIIRTDLGRMTRYTSGAAGAILTEKGLPIPQGISRQLVAGLLEPVSSISEASQFGLSDQMRSGVAVWCRQSDRTVVLLLLASTQTGDLTATGDSNLTYLGNITDELLTDLRVRRARKRQAVRIGRFQQILNRSMAIPDLEATGKAIATFLRQELQVDLVRLTTADQSPSFLRTFGFSCGEGVDCVDEVTILRSHLRVHEEVLSSGKAVWLDAERSDLSLSQTEAHSMLTAPLGAVAIMPIRTGTGFGGTISIASGRSGRRGRFSRSERQLIALLAQVAGTALLNHNRAEAGAAWSVTRPSDRQLRSRMKSSLSGILGSLELMRMPETNERQLAHYLSIIDSSARRINDYLTTGSSATSVLEGEGKDVHPN